MIRERRNHNEIPLQKKKKKKKKKNPRWEKQIDK